MSMWKSRSRILIIIIPCSAVPRQGGEPPCSRRTRPSSGTSVARTLASYWATLTTPSAAGYYVNIPSLTPLPSPLLPSHPSPLIQQLPVGLIHTESLIIMKCDGLEAECYQSARDCASFRVTLYTNTVNVTMYFFFFFFFFCEGVCVPCSDKEWPHHTV